MLFIINHLLQTGSVEEASFALNEQPRATSATDISTTKTSHTKQNIVNNTSLSPPEDHSEKDEKIGDTTDGTVGSGEDNELTMLSSGRGERNNIYPSPCLSPNSTLRLGTLWWLSYFVLFKVQFQQQQPLDLANWSFTNDISW